ncbi:hypothetical protein U9M48_008285 [Paspalum notatum var. saurae]|uniref:Uncharacterized protein n=1 Tax=Paspalum notatum var. saurae TaxID=547442 RepID=A0AAQ3WD50_PASNO
MHMKENLLNCICDIRPGEGEIFQGTSKTPVDSRISNWGAHILGQLGLGVDRGGIGVAISHPRSLQDIESVLPLVEEKARRTGLNGDTQEVMEHTKILHSKLLLQGCDDALKQVLTIGYENNVIHIEQQICSLISMAIDEQRHSVVKKRILQVQLVHRPGAGESRRENCAHCSRLHHWAESHIIVHARALGEAPENPASLVAIQDTTSSPLMHLDPLANDHIATRRTRHQVPRLVGKKSRILLFHRAVPVRVCQGVTDGRWYRRDPRLLGDRGESCRPKNTSRPSRHRDGCDEDPDGERADTAGSTREATRGRRGGFGGVGPASGVGVKGGAEVEPNNAGTRTRDARSARGAPGPRVVQQGATRTLPGPTHKQGWQNHRVSEKQGLQLEVGSGGGGGGEREIRLVKHHVPRDKDSARREVEATVPLVVRGVTKKHTPSRTGRQLVGSSGGGVRVTCTPEDMEVIIARRGTEESVV